MSYLCKREKKQILSHLVLYVCVSFFIMPAICHASRDKEIITFGDSITEGYGEVSNNSPGDRVGGYQAELEKLTDAINNHYDVLNYGLGAERTIDTERHPYPEGGYHRLKNQVLPSRPNAEYILILEGTNDVWDSISHQTTVYNLGVMVDMAKSYGIIPILGTLTPDTRPGIDDFKNIPSLNQLIRDLAIQKNVKYADFYPAMIDQWNTLYSGCSYGGLPIDFLHPCPEGYDRMGEIWFETLGLPAYLHRTPWIKLLLKD